MRIILCGCLLSVVLGVSALGEDVPALEQFSVNAHGSVESILAGGRFLSLETEVWVVPDWDDFRTTWDARDVTLEQVDGAAVSRWRYAMDGGATCRIEQAVLPGNGGIELRLSVTSDADLDLNGLYLHIHPTIADFAGGRAMFEPSGAEATLPVQFVGKQILAGPARRVTLADRAGGLEATLDFHQRGHVTLQDSRQWQDDRYGVRFQFHSGGLKANEPVTAQLTIATRATPDDRPARLMLDAGERGYRFDGFGGNYVYGLDSDVTRRTIEEFDPAWARVEMLLAEFDRDNARSREAVRRRFQVDQRLHKDGARLVASIWRLPERFYAEPVQGWRDSGGVVPAERWDAVVDAIVSYMRTAREEYGVEYDLFSFNESDWGVYVKLTAEEHRDTIKRIGERFAAEGLKTKLILGDTASAGRHDFLAPALDDPEAMLHVGAMAFHAWSGSESDYQQWGEIAEAHRLPLLVTEMGYDARSWRIGTYNGLFQSLGELRRYQELLMHARPQAILEWEFSKDYPLLVEEDGELHPTMRYAFIRQFLTLTPKPADALATRSDHPQVLFTAFARRPETTDAIAPRLTLHIANLTGERETTIEGLPAEINSVRVHVAASDGSNRTREPAPVRDGQVTLALPARSLVTLTAP